MSLAQLLAELHLGSRTVTDWLTHRLHALLRAIVAEHAREVARLLPNDLLVTEAAARGLGARVVEAERDDETTEEEPPPEAA